MSGRNGAASDPAGRKGRRGQTGCRQPAEPGERSKIAVYTAVEGLDPIGSCVGPKGSRVKNVVDELHGEMIDIVEWSSDPVVYISHALSPSDVLTVSVDEEKHSALVIVPDDQLS